MYSHIMKCAILQLAHTVTLSIWDAWDVPIKPIQINNLQHRKHIPPIPNRKLLNSGNSGNLGNSEIILEFFIIICSGCWVLRDARYGMTANCANSQVLNSPPALPTHDVIDRSNEFAAR